MFFWSFIEIHTKNFTLKCQTLKAYNIYVSCNKYLIET